MKEVEKESEKESRFDEVGKERKILRQREKERE